MKKILLIIGVLITGAFLKAQITTDPAIPTADAAVTITFDATGTPLAGYTGEVYTHTGVLVEGLEGWQHVIGSWGNNTNQPKLTRVSSNIYQLVISPSINNFYSVDANEKVTKLCFVFRSATPYSGSSYYKTADLFVNVYEEGLAVSITSPTEQPYFIEPSSNFYIHVASTFATSVLVKKDGELVHTENANPAAFDYNVMVETSGTHEITVEAIYQNDTSTDNFIYVVRTTPAAEALPSGVRDGINYIAGDSVVFVLHAPYKNTVYAFGDFNGWKPVLMKRTDSDINNQELRYWVGIGGLTPGQEYFFQYIVDDTIRIADPYSDKISDPWNDKYINENRTIYPGLIDYPEGKTEGITSVFQTAQTPYSWQATDFTAPQVEDLVIYELLIRDFTTNADYQTMIDTISYLKKLGINAVELMPINEFEGNSSWGYNPAFYFAPDKAYGTKDKLKEFIDICHQNGIAVIIDMVLNHSYGQSPLVKLYFDPDAGSYGQPTAQNLWYNQISPNSSYSWGYDFNHESEHTKQFVDSVNNYWLTQYKVDGFRFDFTKGFTNTTGDGWAYDAPRIAILKRMYDKIKTVNPDAYVILEHLTVNTEETELANYGMMLWGNMNSKYNEATMGYHDNSKSDFSWASYKQRGWSQPNLVTYMESHDEERLMYKNISYGNSSGNYNIKTLSTALKRIEMAGCFFLTIPGPKMIWQFGELGYDYSINYPGNDANPKRIDPKPVRWDYYDVTGRYRLFQVFQSLIKLKKEQEVFKTTDYTLNVSGSTKWINLNGNNMDVTIIGNFGVTQTTAALKVQYTGTWYDYFNGTSITVSDVNQNITLAPGEYHIFTSVQLEKPDITYVNKMASDIKTIDLKVYPNPADLSTRISFNMDEMVKDADISIFDLSGKKINTIHKGQLNKGEQKFEWNLNNQEGGKVPVGAYLVRIDAGSSAGNSVIIVK